MRLRQMHGVPAQIAIRMTRTQWRGNDAPADRWPDDSVFIGDLIHLAKLEADRQLRSAAA